MMSSITQAMFAIKEIYPSTEATSFGFKVTFNLGAEFGNRSQLVYITPFEALDAIVIHSPFAMENQISLAQAVNASQNSCFGMKLLFERYVLSHVLFTEDLDVSEIVNGFEILAGAADIVEQRLGLGDDL